MITTWLTRDNIREYYESVTDPELKTLLDEINDLFPDRYVLWERRHKRFSLFKGWVTTYDYSLYARLDLYEFQCINFGCIPTTCVIRSYFYGILNGVDKLCIKIENDNTNPS